MNTITEQPSSALAPPYCVPPRRLELGAGFVRFLRNLARWMLSPGERRLPAPVIPRITENIVGYVDRRGKRELEAFRALEQSRLDKELLIDFEDRVRRNEARRYFAAMSERPGILRRQAE